MTGLLFPPKELPVVHAFPDPHTGVMRCCDLHRLEVEQKDRATVEPGNVTCEGKKRYRKTPLSRAEMARVRRDRRA